MMISQQMVQNFYYKYSKHKKIKYFINKSKKKIYLQLMQKIVI